jgi:hypothetical protein
MASILWLLISQLIRYVSMLNRWVTSTRHVVHHIRNGVLGGPGLNVRLYVGGSQTFSTLLIVVIIAMRVI